MSAHERTMTTADERTLQFDPRCLDSGDRVDVFYEAESRWTGGTFEISTSGEALIRLLDGRTVSFSSALRMGLRRTLN